MNNSSENICVKNDSISLLYATLADRRTIFDMDFEDKTVYDSIFHGLVQPHPYNEEPDEEDIEFHKGCKNKNNYLLIEYDNQIIGAISHTYNKGPIENMEIDITIRSAKFIGRGLGSQTIILLTDYLHNEYSIKTFIIRPSKLNKRAIRAYEKSGFKIIADYNGSLYGDTEEDYYGDYGKDGTENMVKTYE